MKEKMHYKVTHAHRFGGSCYVVASNHHPSEDEVVAALDLDFEPHLGEFITIDPVTSEDIKDIPDRPEAPSEEWQGDSDGSVGVD